MKAFTRNRSIHISTLICAVVLLFGFNQTVHSRHGGGGHHGGGHHHGGSHHGGGWHGGGHHTGGWGHGGRYGGGWRYGGWGYGGVVGVGGVSVGRPGCLWIPKHWNRNGYLIRGHWSC